MTEAIANKTGNLGEVYNDCSSTKPTGQVRYVAPNAAEVKQGKIVRDEAAVKKTQEALGMTGKDADGMWGNKTTEAVQRRIEQFQKDNGLEVTGRYTAETSEKMKKDPANKALGEALDGARNRDVLARVYRPMEKQPAGVEDASCRRDGATGGAAPKTEILEQKTSRAPVTPGKPVIDAKTTPSAPDESAAETQRLAGAGRKPQENMIANAGPATEDLSKPAGVMRRTIERTPDSAIANAAPAQMGGAKMGGAAPEGKTVFVQPVARFDAAGKELAEGAKSSPGATYSPSLGGDVVSKGLPQADINEGGKRMQALLDGFKTDSVASVGSLTKPPLATPGIADLGADRIQINVQLHNFKM